MSDLPEWRLVTHGERDWRVVEGERIVALTSREEVARLLLGARETEAERASLSEKWDRFAGGEAEDRLEQRSAVISEALRIQDQSTTRQVEAIRALWQRLQPAAAEDLRLWERACLEARARVRELEAELAELRSDLADQADDEETLR